MTTEATTTQTVDTPSDPFVEAGGAIQQLLFGNEPTEPAPASKEEPTTEQVSKPEGKPEEKPEEKKEKPAWQIALARKKLKAAEKKETETTQYVEKVQQAASHVAEQGKAISRVIDGIRNDPAKAFDEICELAGLDPIKAFEALAMKKVKGVDPKPLEQRPKNPEVEALKAELEALKGELRRGGEQTQQQALANAKIREHVGVQGLLDTGEYTFAKMLPKEDLENAIVRCVTAKFHDPNFRGATSRDIANAIDQMARAEYSKWNKTTPEPAKPPAKKTSAKVPTNADSSESAPRELSEREAFEAAGEAILNMFGHNG